MNERYFQRKLVKEKSLLIDDLDISIRLYQFLKNHIGIVSLDELSNKTEKEIKETRGFTSPNLKELKSLLQENGLSLKIEDNEILKNGLVNETEKLKNKINKIENYTDLYNIYGIIKNGVTLDENNKIILSTELMDEGWKTGMTFQEGLDDKQSISAVLSEIDSKKFLYDIKIAFLRDEPFSKIRCLLLKYKDL